MHLSSTRVHNLRQGFINAFQSIEFGKEADILFSKPDAFLRTEVKIVTAMEEEKGSFSRFNCSSASESPVSLR